MMDYRCYVLIILGFTSKANEIRLDEACETEIFNATCSDTEVIMITHAIYGRMRLGRCVKLDYGHIGCRADVSSAASARCSYKRDCAIEIPDAIFATSRPCPDDLKPYLEVKYYCQEVAVPIFPLCTSLKHRTLVARSGFLASIITHETGCGGTSLPWHIKLSPGQRIKISVHYHTSLLTRFEEYINYCPTIAIIREKNSLRKHNLTLCDTAHRKSSFYLSGANEIEIGLKLNEMAEENWLFLIHYQAVGCGNLAEFKNAWISRSRHKAIINCNHSSHSWSLDCINNSWIGEIGNCTPGPLSISPDSSNLGNTLAVGSSLLIIIFIAIAIGVIVLFIGLFCLKRKRDSFIVSNPSHSRDIIKAEKMGKTSDGYHVSQYYWKKGPEKAQNILLTSDPGLSNVQINFPPETYGFTHGHDRKQCTPLLKSSDSSLYGQTMKCTCSKFQTASRRPHASFSCTHGHFPDSIDKRLVILEPDVVNNQTELLQLKTFRQPRHSCVSNEEGTPSIYALKSPKKIPHIESPHSNTKSNSSYNVNAMCLHMHENNEHTLDNREKHDEQTNLFTSKSACEL